MKRKKLITALSMFALVVVVAAASVGITLAALSGSVTSDFTIKYNALNVNATVSGQYTVKTEEAKKLENSADSPANVNEIEFKAEDGAATGTFKAVSLIELTKDKDEVIFEYTFKNNDETNSLLVKLSTEPTSTSTNLGITYETGAGDEFDDEYSTLQAGVTVAKQESVTIKIKFKITDAKDPIAGDTFNLTWALSGVTAAA